MDKVSIKYEYIKIVILLMPFHIFSNEKLAFSFSSTMDEASGGTGGQTAGMGQDNMLSEALVETKEIYV